MSWTTCTLGHAHWGPRGAAGLLVASRGQVLLQLRARWAHQGGTWSIPGGAIERGETSVETALREAHEELGVDAASIQTHGSYVAVCGGWSCETVLASPVDRLLSQRPRRERGAPVGRRGRGGRPGAPPRVPRGLGEHARAEGVRAGLNVSRA